MMERDNQLLGLGANWSQALAVALFLMLFQMPIESAELNNAFKEKAFAAMKSSDAKKRKAAYRAFQHLGKETLEDYETILKKAQAYHSKALNHTMGLRGNPYTEHARGLEELKTERARVMKLIHTDWEKAPSKIKMLENEVEKIERKYGQLVKLAKAKTESIDQRNAVSMSALLETQWELASMERLHGDDNGGDLPSGEELEVMIAEEFYQVEGWLEQKEQMQVTRDSEKKHTAAKNHNAASKWATSVQKDFSDELNKYRVIMGQSPFLLEERLSIASEGHSTDMRTGGFFAHESPVKGKTSPGDRARVAKFSGRFTGENIYRGSPTYTAAYQAWFGSDGHRFIMFSKGASNVIGVGVDGGHWTMMTGRKK